MLTAHSGSDHYQDNSREFVEAALASTIDSFEIDCRLAPDGTLYLHHDEVEEISGLLTLPMVYQLMVESPNKTTMINVDCKEFEVGRLALDLAREYGILNRVVLSGSLLLDQFEPDEMSHLFFNLENLIPWEELALDPHFDEVVAKISQYGVKVVQTHYSAANEAMIAALANHHLKLSVWTVNEVALIDHYLQLGCLNVTSRIAFHYLDLFERRTEDENGTI